MLCAVGRLRPRPAQPDRLGPTAPPLLTGVASERAPGHRTPPPARRRRCSLARRLVGALAELRCHDTVRRPARPRPARRRPRRRAPRPRQQLRPAAVRRRGVGRAACWPVTCAAPRRAPDHHEGRVPRVARAVRRARLREVPARLARRVAAPAGHRPRRRVLQPPVRPRHAARGDARARSTGPSGRARHGTRGSRRTRPTARSRRSPWPASLGLRLAVHQPAYSMLNRWVEQPGADGRLAARRRRRRGDGRRRVLPAGPGHARARATCTGSPADSRAARGGRCGPSGSPTTPSTTCGRSMRSPAPVVARCLSSRSPGCSATRA